MQKVPSSGSRLSAFRALLPFMATAALALPAGAVAVTEDFEDDPAHPFSWTNTQNAAATTNWAVLLNGSAASPTSLLANAFSGVSFTGAQALVVAAAPGSAVTVQRTSPLSAGGTAFAGVAVRFPQILLAGNPPDPSTLLPADSSLTLEGVRFAFLNVTPGLAQWYFWHSSSGVWQAVGPMIPVSAGADGLAGEWIRLNLRRDTTSRNEADLWVNGKPVAVQIPLDATLSGFSVRASSFSSAYVDALVFNDAQHLFADGDKDGMPDSWEFLYSSVPGQPGALVVLPSLDDREADADGDGVSNIREYLAGSNPLQTDSDGDLMPDAWELQYGLNPADAKDGNGDYDFDGVLNSEEFTWGTSPRSASGNGSSIKYVRAIEANFQNDLGQPVGSLANPYSYFSIALGSVPDGGKLVVLGGGGPINLASQMVWDESPRNLTITGVGSAKLIGVSAGPSLLTFLGGDRTVTLDNLTFSYCRAGAGGGAVSFSACPAAITRCRFENCSATTGGAISFTGGTADVRDSDFYGNAATSGGGAISASGTTLSLQRNRFIGQSSGTGGAALKLLDCSGEISSCLFAANQCTGGGGGAILLAGSLVPVITYSTIADNLVTTGAAVDSTASVPVTLIGCILWGNKLSTNSAVVNLSGSAALTATTTQGTTYPGLGNNISNPMFLRAYHPQMAAVPGDGYGLSAGSPMIDRGAGTLVPALDIDGLTRRRFLPNPSSLWVCNADRGAFDYSDADGDNMPDGWELLYSFDGNNPDDRDLDADQDGYSNYEEYSLKTNPRSDASRAGVVIYVASTGNELAPGTITNPVKTISRAITLGPSSGGRIAVRDGSYSGSGNINLSNSSKSWTLVGINGAGRVTIDCENTSRFITGATYSSSLSGISLSGITVRNCLAASGHGGAICWASYNYSPITLYRCRFINCRAPAGTGGALYITSGSVTKCEFLGNTASQGGAAGGASSTFRITMQDNAFAWNDAAVQGGALSWTSASSAFHNRNTFHRNSALTGGAVAFKDCYAFPTTASTNPNSPGTPSAGNPPNGPGSYFYNDYASGATAYLNSIIVDSVFTENSAWPTAGASAPGTDALGGAVSLTNSTIWLAGGSFEKNLSAGSGGALAQPGGLGVSQLYRAKFLSNEAVVNGGAACQIAGASSQSFINCAFVGNKAANQGGVFHISSTAPSLTLRHATLTRNTAPTGAVAWNAGPLTIHNSLLWFNSSAAASLAGTGTKQIFGSNGETGSFALGGTSGNTAVPPVLAWDDIHLTGNPAALNSALTSLASQAAESGTIRDLDYETRPANTGNPPDAGSDEFLDTDGDGLPDWYEKKILALSPGVSDILPTTKLWGGRFSAMEYLVAGANPLRVDVDGDGDGLSDEVEIKLSFTDKNKIDTDLDGIFDIDDPNPHIVDDGRPGIFVLQWQKNNHASLEPKGWSSGSPSAPTPNLYRKIIASAKQANSSDVAHEEFYTGKTMKIERKLDPLPLRYEQAFVGKTPIYKEVVTYSHATGLEFVDPNAHENPDSWSDTAPGAIAGRDGWIASGNVQHHDYFWSYAAPVVNVSKFGEFGGLPNGKTYNVLTGEDEVLGAPTEIPGTLHTWTDPDFPLAQGGNKYNSSSSIISLPNRNFPLFGDVIPDGDWIGPEFCITSETSSKITTAWSLSNRWTYNDVRKELSDLMPQIEDVEERQDGEVLQGRAYAFRTQQAITGVVGLEIYQFRFKKIGGGIGRTTLHWLETFHPDDNPETPNVNEHGQSNVDRLRSITLLVNATESPIYTLDPRVSPYTQLPGQPNEPPTFGSTDVGSLLLVELKVTDFATKTDAKPYTATAGAAAPKNSELCLNADKTTEKAKIEIEMPSITDAAMLAKLRWKVVQKPADTVVQEAVFSATPAAVELSLGSAAAVEDEILFEVQVGADGGTFTAASKMNVRVVRDRLNWWFEPFSTGYGWRTAKPESRVDTGDYPAHKATAYTRESLQSVYEFYKSTTAIGPSTPKANWVKPSITCFGQFLDALKAANGNNPLVDLSSLARIDMTAVAELPSFEIKYSALRSAQGRQTTYPADDNPTLRTAQFPERVQWATTAATAIGSQNLPKGRLLAIWQKEGSLRLNTQSSTITSFDANLAATQLGAVAPASSDNAKVCYVYDATYQCLGSDFLIQTYRIGGAGDNIPDLRDYTAAMAHIQSKADQIGGSGSGAKLFNALTGTAVAGGFTVSVNASAFYEELLRLVGLYYLAGWQPEGPDVSYMVYNMGVASFNSLKGTLGNAAYPERSRLGLADWAFHYEIRPGEYTQPRDHAQKFYAYRVAFEAKYP